MRHPAQDIRHTTSVPKQFVKSDYIEATLSFSASTSFRCFRSASSLLFFPVSAADEKSHR